MPINRPQPLEQLLNDGQFRRLCRHSQVLRTLQRHFGACCDKHRLQQCRVANFRNGILVIEVGSAAWRQRLNLLRVTLLSELRQQLPQLVTLEVVQNPAMVNAAGSRTSTERKRKISPQAAAHLEALAATAPPGLQEKLRRLAALAGEK